MSKIKKIYFNDLRILNKSLKTKIDNSIQKVIKNSNYILGNELIKFENQFSKFIKCKYSIGVSNGLDALKLSLISLNLKKNDEVIVPANSFFATALAVSNINVKPVFVDCNVDTYNICLDDLKKKISKKTKVIIIVHLGGNPIDVFKIKKMISGKRIYLIEDAAQAHGASIRNKFCGTMGDLGCFSFYPTKNLGAMGDGGIITTNNINFFNKIKKLRNYGQSSKYNFELLGFNARLDEIQASILQVKLKSLKLESKKRIQFAKLYKKLLKNIGDLKFQHVSDNSINVYHLFYIQTKYRNKLKVFLEKNDILTGIHYPVPIHLQKAYKFLNYSKGSFPNAEKLSKNTLSLPMHINLSKNEILYVCKKIKQFFNFYE